MLSLVKMLLKGEFEGCALNSHGNYIVDHGKSWKNHGIVFLNFCGNPGLYCVVFQRLIVEFSLENRKALEVQQRRKEKQKVKHQLCDT